MKKNKVLNVFFSDSKWTDYINYKHTEVVLSAVASLITVTVILNLDIYNNLNGYIDVLKSLSLGIIQGFIGLIGIIIAGIAIVATSINKEIIRVMRDLDIDDDIKALFKSFEFLGYTIGILITNFTILYILLFNTEYILPSVWFYSWLIVSVYLFYFSIFYTISLVTYIKEIHFISQDLNLINDLEESSKHESRIDYILSLIEAGYNEREELLLYIAKVEDVDSKEKLELIKLINIMS